MISHMPNFFAKDTEKLFVCCVDIHCSLDNRNNQIWITDLQGELKVVLLPFDSCNWLTVTSPQLQSLVILSLVKCYYMSNYSPFLCVNAHGQHITWPGLLKTHLNAMRLHKTRLSNVSIFI